MASFQTLPSSSRWKCKSMKYLSFFVLALLICLPAAAQQQDISRYTLYTGFDSMISPARSLTEYGFDLDFGVTIKPWLALGGDFGALGNSIINGSGTIKGTETVYAPIVSAAGGDPSHNSCALQIDDVHLCRGPAILSPQVEENYSVCPSRLRGNSRVRRPDFPAGVARLAH